MPGHRGERVTSVSGFVEVGLSPPYALGWIHARCVIMPTSRVCAYSDWNVMNHRTPIIALCGFASAMSSLTVAPSSASPPATQVSEGKPSEGIYRLPFADGTKVKVFDDFHTHRPMGRIDLFAIEGPEPYRVVAAAAGRIVAIQDSYDEQQSGRAAADCHNNYIWIAHANGEWTNYSHVAHGSATQKAKLKVGDRVEAGQYIGDEDAIGCAMLT